MMLTKEEKVYLDSHKDIVEAILKRIPAVKSLKVNEGDHIRVTVTSKKYPMQRRTKKIYELLKFMEEYGLEVNDVSPMSRGEVRRRIKIKPYIPFIRLYHGSYEQYKWFFGCNKPSCDDCKNSILCNVKINSHYGEIHGRR